MKLSQIIVKGSTFEYDETGRRYYHEGSLCTRGAILICGEEGEKWKPFCEDDGCFDIQTIDEEFDSPEEAILRAMNYFI